MKKIHKITLAIIAVFSAGLIFSTTVNAVDALDHACQANPQSAICQSRGDSLPNIIKNIINTLIFLIGAIAVLMIVIGGLRYVTSGGESSSVTGAKNTILYAIIGLIVALSAYGIVNFVLMRI